ncbi:MAG TPA: hypothetical protein VM537_26085 [Anaerolineae bacterium]|nr:hypothetical protein [Anaerolineae bacterium]
MSERVLYQCPECGYRELAGDDVAVMACPYHTGADDEQVPVQMVQVWPPRWRSITDEPPETWIHVLILRQCGIWEHGYLDDDGQCCEPGGRRIIPDAIAWQPGPVLPVEEVL